MTHDERMALIAGFEFHIRINQNLVEQSKKRMAQAARAENMAVVGYEMGYQHGTEVTLDYLRNMMSSLQQQEHDTETDRKVRRVKNAERRNGKARELPQ